MALIDRKARLVQIAHKVLSKQRAKKAKLEKQQAKAAKKQIKEEYIEAEPMYQPITETIETNYMPYVVSVMVSRAIPEIDGFKPSHRKLLILCIRWGL
jgi:DNA gyrase subunit A